MLREFEPTLKEVNPLQVGATKSVSISQAVWRIFFSQVRSRKTQNSLWAWNDASCFATSSGEILFGRRRMDLQVTY